MRRCSVHKSADVLGHPSNALPMPHSLLFTRGCGTSRVVRTHPLSGRVTEGSTASCLFWLKGLSHQLRYHSRLLARRPIGRVRGGAVEVCRVVVRIRLGVIRVSRSPFAGNSKRPTARKVKVAPPPK